MEGEGFLLVGGNGLPSSTSEYSLKRNNYNDGGTVKKDEFENLKKQQQQQAQHPSYTYTEACLFSWWGSPDDIDRNFEPFPLDPPPTLNDQNSRFEALYEFLDLAIPQLHEMTGHHDEEESAPSEKSVDEDEPTRQKSPVETANDDESQNTHQMQIGNIGNKMLNVEYYNSIPRIRDYQEQQWENHFMDLVAFHQREGHCCVPHGYKENPGLARWVKRQRHQFKLLQQRVSKSTMLPHRIKALEKLGFVWDSHSAQWEEQLRNLIAFRMMYDHCNVPSVFPANPQLSTWVSRQRRHYREGHMPQSRQDKLNELGFEWKAL